MKNTYKLALSITLLLLQQIAAAQGPYHHDRVYTANQISNTVSVIDPSTQALLGEIVLGKPEPDILTPLYKGQALVHGLRYNPQRKMLAVVSIGSNGVSFVSTETNKVLKTVYVGRAPHEPTFTPDGKQVWISIRGEAYISVIDMAKMIEIKRIPVADGPGMVAFTTDGKFAYICSSFSPEVDVVSTSTYKIVKKIPVISPFSPNIFYSADGKWMAITHKDVGKVSVINTATMSVSKVLTTGPVTNHVSFTILNNKPLMLVTVGGENKLRTYDVNKNFTQTDSVALGKLPHGLWPSPDGKFVYVGLENDDQVQAVDLQKMEVVKTINIGQSPQALVYAANAVAQSGNALHLSPLTSESNQVITLKDMDKNMGKGVLVVRSIGLTDLVNQSFNHLIPHTQYTLALTKSAGEPYTADYLLNTFITDEKGNYMGQTTGVVKTIADKSIKDFAHVILQDSDGKMILMDSTKK